MNAFDEHAAYAAASIRHFIELDEISHADLRAIIDEARARKDRRAGWPRGRIDADTPLDGRMLALVFEKPSTRTRVSFDMAMRQLGGQTITLNSADMQLGRGETVSDTSKVLSRFVDAVMLRTYAPETMLEMAACADVPVINGLTDRSHPCQIMADLLTFEEHVGPLKGAKLAWCGDGNNVAASFIQAAAAFDFEFAIACPDALKPDAKIVERARQGGGRISLCATAQEAAQGADAVITDTWLSMNDDSDRRQARYELLKPFQVTSELMDQAKPGAVFMHCLPAHRGEEATAEVMDGPRSVIFDEAENRLHAQKAVLLWCFGII